MRFQLKNLFNFEKQLNGHEVSDSALEAGNLRGKLEKGTIPEEHAPTGRNWTKEKFRQRKMAAAH